MKIGVVERLSLGDGADIDATRSEHSINFANSDKGIVQVLENSKGQNTVHGFCLKRQGMPIG